MKGELIIKIRVFSYIHGNVEVNHLMKFIWQKQLVRRP